MLAKPVQNSVLHVLNGTFQYQLEDNPKQSRKHRVHYGSENVTKVVTVVVPHFADICVSADINIQYFTFQNWAICYDRESRGPRFSHYLVA
jgi:hypothetical protein